MPIIVKDGTQSTGIQGNDVYSLALQVADLVALSCQGVEKGEEPEWDYQHYNKIEQEPPEQGSASKFPRLFSHSGSVSSKPRAFNISMARRMFTA